MAEAGEAERFHASLAADFDTAGPLRWGFLLDGASEGQVGPLIDAAGRLGFTEVEPLPDEEREGQFTLSLSEVRAHTARSFAARLAAVQELAVREGLVVADYTAGLPE